MVISEYGWTIHDILDVPYDVLIGLIDSIVRRRRRDLAELILVAHAKDPQKLFNELTSDGRRKESIDELIEQFREAGIPVEVRRKKNA